ncbi:dihydrolipoyl dehydrogenase [Vallitalea longa]|uniref:Dihydrolipoyl dehydrogenase n=1 Tax=Vallitalea longa TaxID=2936439 RepID=A0A9W6DES9_9FIRM|nr:dihydrolipoyl dehydrogenase [Vallitalea longa]GKX27904.1 dihydrolipoyl dehydrogenase [Vallitalea longa]
MDIEVKLDKLSGHAKDGKIGKIHKTIGDQVTTEDILFNIESKKGNMPIKASTNGILKNILVEEGQSVEIGTSLAVIDGEPIKEVTKENTNKKNISNGANISKTPKSNFSYFGGLLKPEKLKLQSDITIIGGGPGGYVAAIQAAKLGAKVILIEKDKVGGTCLNYGCIPTKAIVRSSEVYRDLKNHNEYGLHADNISVDMKKVIERKSNIVDQLVNGIEYLLDKNNVKVIKGTGKILDANSVFVKSNKQEITVTTKNIIIATGSKTSMIPIKGIDLDNVITSKEALELNDLPDKLIIVGGGIIGMEFAFIYSSFGVDVSVVEFLENTLLACDKDVCDEINSIAKDSGIKLYTSSKVESIIKSEDGKCIVSFTENNTSKFITGDKVLMAVGRQPSYKNIGLENIDIKLDSKTRGIKVNNKMQTNIPNIYAIGDVTNIIQLAHVASHQGIVAVKNILGIETDMDYTVIPSAIFTNPEIAMVGVSERTAQEDGLDIEIGKFPFAANGKALTLGESNGFVKIIKEKPTGKIIGGSIIGPHATDLIAEITLAIKNGLTTKDVMETIHAHPTTAESIHEAVLATEGGALHFSE